MVDVVWADEMDHPEQERRHQIKPLMKITLPDNVWDNYGDQLLKAGLKRDGSGLLSFKSLSKLLRFFARKIKPTKDKIERQ